MSKYIQKTIPKISTSKFNGLSGQELRKYMTDFYNKNLLGKSIINEHLNIEILFSRRGSNKTAYGSIPYKSKVAVLTVLDKLVKYAKYNNWGNRKAKDANNVVGFLNFKAYVYIDGKKECVHLVVRQCTDGRFYYTVEVNRNINKKSK